MVYRNKNELIEAVITPTGRVLDVGFWGQGVRAQSPDWPHRLLLRTAKEVYGVDMEYDEAEVSRWNEASRYTRANAESFAIPSVAFDAIFAGDLIEHLSNPGLFLDACKRHLAPHGILVLTTPNAFNLFNIAMKLARPEPVVNPDHTCYFNAKTIRTLLEKNGWDVRDMGYVYSSGELHRESLKKKILNGLYALLSRVTSKYLETLLVVATPKPRI